MPGFDLSTIGSLLRRATKSLSEQLAALRTEIDRLERERDAVKYAPAARADVKVFVESWVQRCGSTYGDVLQAALREVIRAPHTMQDERRAGLSLSIVMPAGFGEAANARDFDVALCALFGPQLVKALHKALDESIWPDEGLPLVERQRRLEEIDQRLVDLRAQEQGLLDEAQAAGVVLN
ncbi:MAG: hypothetical protein U1E89_04635 [Burkholderiaceae bacterium]